jgi:hypothetical protein
VAGRLRRVESSPVPSRRSGPLPSAPSRLRQNEYKSIRFANSSNCQSSVRQQFRRSSKHQHEMQTSALEVCRLVIINIMHVTSFRDEFRARYCLFPATRWKLTSSSATGHCLFYETVCCCFVARRIQSRLLGLLYYTSLSNMEHLLFSLLLLSLL